MKTNITIQSLKNLVKVANFTNTQQDMSTKISNKEREFSIKIRYMPELNKKLDIYPYWVINMREEATFLDVTVQGKDLKDVRDLHNSFINQGNKSFLETYKF